MSQRGSAEILAELSGHGVRLGLGPFRELLAALGHPERCAPAVLIAGTNGKGSVAALLDAALAAGGYSTLRATSPHLTRPHERVRLRGAPIDEPRLAQLLARVLAAAPALTPPTYFEALVAAAFLAGAEAAVDAQVLEVGLGGRLDATNAADATVAVVTRIGLDHVAELGPTLGAIAREKAGVFRPGAPAVVGAQPAEAAAALAAAAAAAGAPLVRAAALVAIERAAFRGLDGHRLELATRGASYRLDLALAGEHQVDNAVTALAAAEQLAALGFPALDRTAVERGFAAARWPGRLEAVTAPGGATVLFDAAHNADGCAALARFLERLGRPFALLFGALADKQIEAMLPPLADRATAVVLTRPDSPRALDPAELVRRAGALARPPRLEVEPRRALEVALAASPGLLVVAGSITLVGPLRGALGAPEA